MKKLFFLLFISFLSFVSFAQKRDYRWYFNYYPKATLNFNTAPPATTSVPVGFTVEASSSMADSVTGALLFYMNRDTVWDRTNVKFPNGQGLSTAATTPTQMLTLPMPGNNNKYYIITTYAPSASPLLSGVSYSIVDMALNGGMGDIIPAQKNIVAVNTGADKISEGLTAIKHANGYDWWVLSHGLTPGQNDKRYYIFLITGAGVQPVTTQDIGTSRTNTTSYLVTSPDGKKVCSVDIQGHVNLFDFDRCTGTLGNFLKFRDKFFFL